MESFQKHVTTKKLTSDFFYENRNDMIFILQKNVNGKLLTKLTKDEIRKKIESYKNDAARFFNDPMTFSIFCSQL